MIRDWLSQAFGKEDPLLGVLSQTVLFRDLQRGDKRIAGRMLQRKQFSEGDIIFQQDQPGIGLHLVLSGEVDIVKEDVDGVRIQLGRIPAGRCFGELALLDESPLTATAKASEKTEVAILHRSDLLALVDSQPSVGVRIVMALSQMVADRLRRTNRSLRETRDQLEAAGQAESSQDDTTERASE